MAFKYRSLGLILGGILLIASGAFIWCMASTGMVPLKYLAIGAAVFVLLSSVVALLCFDINKTWRSLIGCLLSFVILAVQFFAVDFVNAGTKTLEEITNVGVEYAEVGIYVKTDDPATDIDGLKGYTFGILKTLDRTVTDTAVDNIIKLLGEEITVKEYETIDEAASAMLETDEVNAIIINKAFLDILPEIEGYEDALEKMREVYILEVEGTVTLPDDTTGNTGNNQGGGSGGSTETVTPTEPLVEMPEHVFTVYISGIDCYGKISKRSRSDVNIIATVNTKTKQVLLISTPRDFYVPTSVSGGVPDKLTNAGIYGVDCSRKTLEMLYGIEINYHFRVNFTGFEDIIDALGGITVNSKYAFTTDNGESFVKGENELNGKTALAFARERHSFASGDRQRGKNQMEVIKGVIKKATSIAFLTNYKKVLDSVANSMETNIPYEKITQLIQDQLNTGGEWNVVTYSADGTGASKKPYSQKGKSYVMVPKQETIDTAKRLISEIINDEVPTP